jgi:O-antigen/teichoic acid export membrane protein
VTDAQAAAPIAPFRMSRVGRHALVYGAGILLAKAIAFVMLPVYTRFLTPSDYGVMELIEMTLGSRPR